MQSCQICKIQAVSCQITTIVSQLHGAAHKPTIKLQDPKDRLTPKKFPAVGGGGLKTFDSTQLCCGY